MRPSTQQAGEIVPVPRAVATDLTASGSDRTTSRVGRVALGVDTGGRQALATARRRAGRYRSRYWGQFVASSVPMTWGLI